MGAVEEVAVGAAVVEPVEAEVPAAVEALGAVPVVWVQALAAARLPGEAVREALSGRRAPTGARAALE